MSSRRTLTWRGRTRWRSRPAPPRALRCRALQARWMSARDWRGRRDLAWPLTGNDVVVAHRVVADGELEHPVEHQPTASGAAAVEAEGELIEVVVEGGRAARRPGGCSAATAWPARQPGPRRAAARPGHRRGRGGPLAAPLMGVAEPGQPVVAHPGIGDDLRARLDVVGDEGMQRGGGPVSQQRHAAPADPFRLGDLHRDAGQDLLALRPAAPQPGSSPPI